MEQKEQSPLLELDDGSLQDIQGGNNQGTNIGIGAAGVMATGAALAGGIAIGKGMKAKEISTLENQVGQLQDSISASQRTPQTLPSQPDPMAAMRARREQAAIHP